MPNIPKKTRNLTANVPDDMYAEVEKLATESGVSVSKWVRAIVQEAAERKLKIFQQTMIVRDKKGDYDSKGKIKPTFIKKEHG